MADWCDDCDRSVCCVPTCDDHENLSIILIRVTPRGYGQWRQRRKHNVAFCVRHRP